MKVMWKQYWLAKAAVSEPHYTHYNIYTLNVVIVCSLRSVFHASECIWYSSYHSVILHETVSVLSSRENS